MIYNMHLQNGVNVLFMPNFKSAILKECVPADCFSQNDFKANRLCNNKRSREINHLVTHSPKYCFWMYTLWEYKFRNLFKVCRSHVLT